MSVQGGGGGKKIPPGPAVPPKGPAPEAKKDAAPAPPVPAAKETKEAQRAKAPAEQRKDAFVQRGGDSAQFKSTHDVKLDDAFLQAGTPSGIDNLVRLLEAARGQLLGEHGRMKTEAQKCLDKLVQAGFSEAQLQATRAELLELRRKMAALRKRLQHLQRRLKSTFAHAGKTADANLQKTLSAQLERHGVDGTPGTASSPEPHTSDGSSTAGLRAFSEALTLSPGAKKDA